MKDIDLEKYKSAWGGEKSFDNRIISGLDPAIYLKRRSKGIVSSFRTGLIIDLVLKCILGASFVVLIFLYSMHPGIISVCGILFCLICYLIFSQFKTFADIPGQLTYSDDLRTFLEKGITFYRTKYYKSLYISASSSPLVFISGMFFYNYFKYAGVRPMDLTDFAVLGLFCLVAYVFSAFVHIKHFNIRINQMEKCLSELEEGELSELTVRKQIRQQRIMLLIAVLLLITGIAALVFILML